MLRNLDFFQWVRRLEREGFTTALRLQLREMLTPKISVRQPFRWSREDSTAEPGKIRDLVDWELVLASDNVSHFVRDLIQKTIWQENLPSLFSDFQMLLRDALDLSRELGEADDQNDRGYWDMPSITPHWQNRGHHDWIVLIELLRESWLAIKSNDKKRAFNLADNWIDLPYPTFKRLALFSATFEEVVPADNWLHWLLSDDCWWLWSVQTQREVMRLLVLGATRLRDPDREVLQNHILRGPPRQMFRTELGQIDWDNLKDHMIWIRLGKITAGGASLSEVANARYTDLSERHSDWKLAADERDEFSHWMSGTGDPDFLPRRTVSVAPLTLRDLVRWLKLPASEDPFSDDGWEKRCKDNFKLAAYGLYVLAREDLWPVKRWRDALQVWSNESIVDTAWRRLGPVVKRMPNDSLAEISHTATWWLESAAKNLNSHREIFIEICQRFLSFSYDQEIDDVNPVSRAINHPIGHIADALVNMWFRQELNDGDGLPPDIKTIFTTLCDRNIRVYRHARVILAANLIALFRVDQAWASKYLLPFFSWELPSGEAKAAWDGFLWSPRLYRPLVVAFKADFLATAGHVTELGEHGKQYPALLTFAALDPGDTFTTEELRAAVNALNPEDLAICAQTLVYALEGAGDQRAEQWHNRIEPFWTKIWPKSVDLVTQQIAERLAQVTVASGEAFPAALDKLKGWLKPIEHLDYLLGLLENSKLCEKFPADATILLNAIVGEQPWAPNELLQCLSAIRASMPSMAEDGRFRRLEQFARSRRVG